MAIAEQLFRRSRGCKSLRGTGKGLGDNQNLCRTDRASSQKSEKFIQVSRIRLNDDRMNGGRCIPEKRKTLPGWRENALGQVRR
jgi:hypothetical protein